MSSTSRVAVVTGGSRGIGRVVIRRPAAAGYDVAVVYAVNQTEAAAAVKEVEVVGGVGRAYQADVADASVIEQVFGSVEEQFGGIDVVVNCRRHHAAGPRRRRASTVTRLHLPAYGAYAATKGAVEALVPILTKELAGRDITVNAVAPGPTATDLFLDGKSQEAIDKIARANPMGRLGTPEEIAEVVTTLAHRARWINGQTVFVNGGFA